MTKPADYENPDWTPQWKYVHDWRGYIRDDLRAAWQTFSVEQRRLLAENAQAIADEEVWD